MVVFQDGVRTLKAYRNKKNKKHALVLVHAENGKRGYSYVLKEGTIHFGNISNGWMTTKHKLAFSESMFNPRLGVISLLSSYYVADNYSSTFSDVPKHGSRFLETDHHRKFWPFTSDKSVK